MPLFWASLVFVIGLMVGGKLSFPWWTWAFLACSTLLVGWFTRKIPRVQQINARLVSFQQAPARITVPPALLLGLIFAGACRFSLAQPAIDPSQVSWYNGGGTARIQGMVSMPPDRRDTGTNLVVSCRQIQLLNEEHPTTIAVHGKLLVRVTFDPGFHYGDEVEIVGLPELPPENEEFSYRDYLARQDIFSMVEYARVIKLGSGQGNPILRGIYTFQENARKTLIKIFPAPEAALLDGILLGNENQISTDVQKAFKNTGTTHIIAISGFNIAILAGLFSILFNRLLGRRKGWIAAITAITLYTILVGSQASVVRAAVMGGLALLAHEVGRRQTGLNTLGFTAGVMCLFDPYLLWDVGFQLSFAATLGLVLYAGPLETLCTRGIGRILPAESAQRLARPISEYLLFTLAAQLTTLPILAYHFHSISLAALIANPLVLPPQPLVMVLSGIAVLTGMVYLPLGQILGYLAWPFAAYTIRAVELFARLPHAAVQLGQFSLLLVIIFYAILFLFTFARTRSERLRQLLAPATLLIISGAAAAILWRGVFTQPDGHLHIILLDSGPAQSALILTPEGRSLLVNGGASANKITSTLGRYLSPFERQIDFLVVTSSAKDHLAGLSQTIQVYPPQQVVWGASLTRTRTAQSLAEMMLQQKIPLTPAQPGQRLELGQTGDLQILSNDDNLSVMLLEWDNFQALLIDGQTVPPDLTGLIAQNNLVNPIVLINQKLFQSSEWLADLHPSAVLISGETLTTQASGASVYQTARTGWIELTTDGQYLWVTAQNSP